jgi:hypothetical protein
MWSGLIRLGRWDLVIFVGAEFIYNLLRLVYSFLIAALFVQRRSSLPRLMVIYLIATGVMETLDSLLVYYLVQDNKDAFDGLPQVLISTAIWVPYFLKSIRVKETFVERIDDGHGGIDRSADDLPSGVTE